ncbi:DUF2188 domain-containing protein [Flavobacterium sp. DG1-102-2]|uniref:DUF2188 domain-containing protein n=1 Tax=Flavobacterium sp. DG1-102-2 TaxID=3081663 RepID=UPI002948C8EA|nr:DUF2188 domain-containing protein [Flavobacterium sp. DG1-102-2]MDV6167903.1 DUF2188 domain-containing protein [Flavobacterium sp. DG1-102-2]
MTQRTVYHVQPNPNGWEGMMEGALRASIVSKTKEEVLEKTIQLAQNREPSSVIIHKADGTIQEERSYGSDPYPPKG